MNKYREALSRSLLSKDSVADITPAHKLFILAFETKSEL